MNHCRRIRQYVGGLAGIAAAEKVAVAPDAGKVAAVQVAAAGHPIVAVAPEIAVAVFAAVHVGRGIGCVWIVVSLVLRRQVASGNR